MHDEQLLWQWNKVLRFGTGQQVILFDGEKTERLYNIAEMSKTEAHLKLVTQLSLKKPHKHIYVFWSLLKKENNEYIIQKCTEIGVSNFVPIISERTIKKDFNQQRTQKISIEASEQCGRSTLPDVRSPIHLEKAIEEYKDKIKLLVCHIGSEGRPYIPEDKIGIFIGPEGGWSEAEKEIFLKNGIDSMNLGDFTLRAETAAIVAASKLL